jgi:hypothetical protein
MLHPAYHASLTADVVSAQNEEFPVYPESATRRLLWNAWLPDAFLNPHGYPTHEWVQPFSEYSSWMTTRTGAETGRTNWVPRGCFTSLGYLGDDEHPDSRIGRQHGLLLCRLCREVTIRLEACRSVEPRLTVKALAYP